MELCPICQIEFHPCNCKDAEKWKKKYCGFICYMMSDDFKEDCVEDFEEYSGMIDDMQTLLQDCLKNSQNLYDWFNENKKLIKNIVKKLEKYK